MLDDSCGYPSSSEGLTVGPLARLDILRSLTDGPCRTCELHDLESPRRSRVAWLKWPPVVLGSEDSTSVSVPDVPVTVIIEVLGRGRRCRAAARIIDGDIPPNTQLGFGWLLVS